MWSNTILKHKRRLCSSFCGSPKIERIVPQFALVWVPRMYHTELITPKSTSGSFQITLQAQHSSTSTTLAPLLYIPVPPHSTLHLHAAPHYNSFTLLHILSSPLSTPHWSSFQNLHTPLYLLPISTPPHSKSQLFHHQHTLQPTQHCFSFPHQLHQHHTLQ